MSAPASTHSGIATLGHGVRWVLRSLSVLVEIGLLITGCSVITSDGDAELQHMVVWDCLALLYLTLGVGGVWLGSRGANAAAVAGRSAESEDDDVDAVTIVRAQRHPLTRRLLGLYWGLVPVVFSLLGLTAALSVVFLGSHDTGLSADVLKGAGAVAMVAAWLLLHVSYARRYQWFYSRGGGGLEFPGDAPRITEIDFLYFAMTLGSSFATSDVNVTSTRMRWHVLIHSVLSFFYNAIVLAVAFRILTGG